MSQIDDIVTAKEAAEFLKTSERHLKSLARRGEIPAKKIGREWRFKISEISKWFANWQPNIFNPNEKAAEIIGALNGKKENRI